MALITSRRLGVTITLTKEEQFPVNWTAPGAFLVVESIRIAKMEVIVKGRVQRGDGRPSTFEYERHVVKEELPESVREPVTTIKENLALLDVIVDSNVAKIAAP